MNTKAGLVVPILIIAVGAGWLLNELELMPGLDWIWTIGLACVGLITLAGGLNRFTAVVGPFLLVASLFSVLRQTGTMRIEIEVPCLVIVLGVLLLIARVARLPVPAWMIDRTPPPREADTENA